MRWRPLLLTLLLLGGCKPKADADVSRVGALVTAPAANANGDLTTADKGPASANAARSPSAPKLAYSFNYTLKLLAKQVHDVIGRDQASCVAAGPNVCQVIGANERSQGRDVANASLDLRATNDWLARFRDGLEGEAKQAGGQIDGSSTQTEDLSRSLVDTQARIRAGVAPGERLEQLVADHTGKLSDVLDAERELTRVQGEIDATHSDLAVMQDQVAMSKLHIDYQAIGVAAPDGAGAPLRAVANGFLGNMLGVFAALVTLMSYLLPIGLVGAPSSGAPGG
jgi:hypothetical protein